MENKILTEWEIVDTLSEGLFSKVYMVRNRLDTSSKAVLKSIPVDYDNLNIAVLRERASFLQSISKEEGFLPWRDFDIVEEDETKLIILTDYYTPFNDLLLSRSFTEKEIIKLGLDVCKALTVLERNRMIHGDIKPSNIFLDQNGNYILGDLDTAVRKVDFHMTLDYIGTPAYAPPEMLEQHIRSSCQRKIDLYALGMMLYRLTHNGLVPFQKNYDNASIREAMIARVEQKKPLEPVTKNPALNHIIRKSTDPNPYHRYKNACMMSEDLKTANEQTTEEIYTISPKSAFSQSPLYALHDSLSKWKKWEFTDWDSLSRIDTNDLIGLLETSVAILGDRGDSGDQEAVEHLRRFRAIADHTAPDQLRDDLITICMKMLENPSYTVSTDEDRINDYICDMLCMKGYRAMGQHRQGISQNGGVGRIDIKTEHEEKTSAIIEALRLGSADTAKLEDHITRLVCNYDPVGIFSHYLLVYYTGNNLNGFYSSLAEKLEIMSINDATYKKVFSTPTYARLREIAVHIKRESISEIICIIVMSMQKSRF